MAELLELKGVYDFLLGPLRISDEIWRKEMRREALRSCLLPSAVTYDQDKVQTSPSDRMCEIMSKIGDLNLQIKALMEERGLAILEVSQKIDSLDDEREKTILDAYYIGGLSMTEIAEHQGYSVSHTYYLRRHGAEKLIGIII